MLKRFFDERSDRWIKAIKTLSIVAFAALMFIGLVEFYHVNFEVGYYAWNFFDLLIERLTPCRWFLLAYIQLSVSMTTINFLNNVQIIREKLEQNDNK